VLCLGKSLLLSSSFHLPSSSSPLFPSSLFPSFHLLFFSHPPPPFCPSFLPNTPRTNLTRHPDSTPHHVRLGPLNTGSHKPQHRRLERTHLKARDQSSRASDLPDAIQRGGGARARVEAREVDGEVREEWDSITGFPTCEFFFFFGAFFHFSPPLSGCLVGVCCTNEGQLLSSYAALHDNPAPLFYCTI
jgi:hypothetical protein